MITMYKLQKDVAGYNGFGLPFTNTKFSATLSVTTDTSLTVPLSNAMGAPLNTINRYLAIITVTANASVYCALNAAAAVPAGSSFAATTSDLIIGGQDYAREVQAGDVLHFYSAVANISVDVLFYALPAC